MTSLSATRRNSFVGWLLIFLAGLVLVVGVAANVARSSGLDSQNSTDSWRSGPSDGSTMGRGFRPNGLSGVDQSDEDTPASTDQSDPKRFRVVGDGILEDAATGIQRRVQGIKAGDSAPSPEAIREFNNDNGDLRSDLRDGDGPRPTRLLVNSIGLDAEVVPIGLDGNRALSVPKRADVTGWWSGGFGPGEFGPTVIVGHFDSRVAPGVFANLKDVNEGDHITIKQSDGSSYDFEVVLVERLHKTEFPTEKVYGPTGGSTLRLVTCGGKFDRNTHHYVDNVIAYADLVSSEGVIARGIDVLVPSRYGPDSRQAPNVLPDGFGTGPLPATGSVDGSVVPGANPPSSSNLSTVTPPVVSSTSVPSASLAPTTPAPTTVAPVSLAPPTSVQLPGRTEPGDSYAQTSAGTDETVSSTTG